VPTRWAIVLVLACIASSTVCDGATSDATGISDLVVYAHIPPRAPITRTIPGTVLVEVLVSSSGHVIDVKVLKPQPFLERWAVAAACEWIFPPDRFDDRRFILQFVFDRRVTMEESHEEVTLENPLTVRVTNVYSTVSRLPESERDKPAGLCAIHRTPLSIGYVRVVYGLPRAITVDGSRASRAELRRMRAYNRVRATHFPNDRAYSLGGCTVGNEEWAEEWYCAECRLAHSAWLAEHPDDMKHD